MRFMKTITASTSRPYDIVIGQGILGQCGDVIQSLFPGGETVIVTDDNVEPLYLDILKRTLEDAGIGCVAFIIPNGEESKSMDIVEELLEFLAKRNVTRTDFITALGGGVVGDLAGFAAAAYLRGIPYIQIPTTLLAAVDSSVGGKTGVNLKSGKNLAGAFHQPSLVWCDYDTHKTMDPERYSDGIAEAIKCAVLKGEDFFSLLETENLYKHVEEVIENCIRLKLRIVSEDEFDTGRRQFLNLGHTIGHAIEARSGYEIPHGHAVACGMVAIADIAATNGLADFDCRDRIANLLKRYGLPTELPYPIEELTPYIENDKKRFGSTLRLIIPENIGHCRMVPIPVEEISSFFHI